MDSAYSYLLSTFIAGYALGSIPFGLVITRLAGLGDLRAIGSGNIGATNVLRTGRWSLAALTLLLDAAKGAAAVLLCSKLNDEAATFAGLGAFIGHCFPIWLGFRGGKGVATFVGALAATAWPIALAFAAIWVAVAFVTRYSSLAALLATAATPMLLAITDQLMAALLFTIMTAISWVKHRENISRLLSGDERKIGAHS
jgi:acyl phosphate:glycerol-3-phosphate acyltransferase